MNAGTSFGVRARPLDFFVAFLVFFMGAYGFLDPNWPEDLGLGDIVYWIIIVEDLYLLCAGLIIMIALIIKQKCKSKRGKWFVNSLIAEMFGWAFIASASFVIAITAPWIPPSAFAESEGPLLWVWIILWGGLGVSSLIRYLDIRLLGRHHG